MKTFAVTAAEHNTAGELVDNQHFTVFDDIVHVALHNADGANRLVDVVLNGEVFRIHQVVNIKEFFGFCNTLLGQRRGLGFFVHDIIAVGVNQIFRVEFGVELFYRDFFQGLCKRVRNFVKVGGFVACAGNNQRGSRFINQNRVHFVDNRKAVTALNALFGVKHHVVTKIVKAHFVVGAVGDVRRVSRLALLVGAFVHNQADGKAHEAVELAHPLRVTARQIVVDGDNVHAFSGKCVEVGG